MNLKKLLSIWCFLVSVILAVTGFAGMASDITIGYWTLAISFILLSGSYFLTAFFYYQTSKDMKYLYLVFFASFLFLIAVTAYFFPNNIDLTDNDINAVISDSFTFSVFLLVFGLIGASLSFAPFFDFGKAYGQASAHFFMYVSILFTLLPLFIIVYQITIRGVSGITLEFLTEDVRDLGQEGGVFPAVVGTLSLIFLTGITVLPIGVGTSIYLAEYAKKGIAVRVIRTAVNILQGTPSIVHGLFGFAVFVRLFGPSLLSASLTLAILTLPIVIRSSEEALNAVPKDIREASLALGGTKWQTIKKVVLPPALPGIITGTVLGLGRAAGETAPILFTGAVVMGAGVPSSIFSEFQALPYHLLTLIGYMGAWDVEQNAWSTAFLLLIIVLGINVVAIILRERYRQRF